MNFNIKKSGINKMAVLYITLALGYGVFLFRPTVYRLRLLDVKIQESQTKLNEYLHTTGKIPSHKLISMLIGHNQDLKGLLQAYKTYLNTVTLEDSDMQLNSQKPSLYFKQKLYQVRKDIYDKTSKAGVSVVNSLGFDEGVPDENQVPKLLIRLAIAKRIAECGIESHLNHIDLIDFNQPQGKDGSLESSTLYYQIPIYLELTASLPSLFKFLYAIQTPPGCFIVKAIDIKSTGEELRVKISLSAIVFQQVNI